MKRLLICLALLVAFAAYADPAPRDGATIFHDQCAPCHEGGVPRAPTPQALKGFEPERVVKALFDGVMAAQGRALTATEARAVASYVTGKPFTGGALPDKAYCSDKTVDLNDPKPFWNGWGGDPTNMRFQPTAKAGLKAADVPRLKLKWAFAIPGVIRAYGQPTVVNGTAYIGTAADKVYALDAKTGCVRWSFDSDAGVRSAISIGRNGGGWAAYFGDLRGQVYAIDAKSGKLLWKTRADDHPFAYITGAVTLHDGRAYVGVASREETAITPDYLCCNFRGSVLALDAANGKIIWKSYTIPDMPKPNGESYGGKAITGPSGGSVWSAPTIDPAKRAVYVGTGNDYTGPEPQTTDAIMAFDMDDGHVRWVQQMSRDDVGFPSCDSPDQFKCKHGPDYDFGSSPILIDLGGGKRILSAGQKSGIVHGLDPDQDGKILWQTRIGKGGYEGGVEFGIGSDGQKIYAPLSDFKFKIAMSGEAGARPTIMGVPALLDPDSGGGLFALDPATGKTIWHAPPPDCHGNTACSPAQSSAPTAIPGIVFSGSVDGHMRAYSSDDGRVIWDFDTNRPFEAVDGIEAHGGSIDGPGAVVVDGVVYTNSGYGYVGEAPGNVLLAFTVDGK